MDDTTSYVRVKQYFKYLPFQDPVTRQSVLYRVELDYDVGIVDNGNEGLYIYGSPFQLFSVAMIGTPLTNSRVLVEPVELGADQLPGAERTPAGDPIHFKFPNI